MIKALLLTALAMVIVGVAAQSATASVQTGTARGQILNTTCPGPCSPDLEPTPYTGEATVVVRRVRSGEIVRRVAAKESRIRAELRPGRYELTVKIDDPSWESDTQRMRVDAGETVRVELHVNNAAVL